MDETRHVVRRVPHATRIRRLQVKEVTDITRRYRRIVLHGADLEGFVSEAPDDHVKLILPDPETGELVLPGVGSVVDESVRARMRDFTPRAFDAQKGELTIDVALHGAGVANAWAMGISAGSELGVGGPRKSTIVPYDFDWYVLAGDECGIPAIARRLEELPSGTTVFVLLEVDEAQDEQPLVTAADARVTWLHRNGAAAGTVSLLEPAVRSLELPAGDGYVFVACEGAAARGIREYLAERGHPKEAQRVGAYWKRGLVDAHE